MKSPYFEGPTSKSPKASLASLREIFRAAQDDAEIEAFARSLESDGRIGARALREQALRRLQGNRREGERMQRLLALRDSLVLRGVRGVAGIDEVGVGPLAGPVVAAAVVLPKTFVLQGLDDSKRVRPARRESLAAEIRSIAVGLGIGEVSVEEIDQVGIFQAALEAMRRAVKSLERVATVDHLLVDARTVPGVTQPQTAIIRGDQKDASIAAASIVAKVHRDTLMKTLGQRYPAYGFERHMGYGTETHMQVLERVGPCPAHRRSFAPVEKAERRLSRAQSPLAPGQAPGS